MQKIIDSHCHIYPTAIAHKAVESVDHFYDGLPSQHYDGTANMLITSGEAAGICHFIVHSVATKPEQVNHINRFIADSMNASGGRFTGMGTMHLDSDDLERDFNDLVNMGLKGVKLHPDIQRFYADDPRAMRIYAMCQERDLPVCVHTGDFRYDYSNPPRVEPVLKAYPHLKFIGAHFGGWSVWQEAAARLADYPNIHVDTSSSLFWLKPQEAKQIIRAYGSERVMYGTDYPFWPQKWEIDYLLRLELDEEEYENIFWRSCAQLFDIKFDE